MVMKYKFKKHFVTAVSLLLILLTAAIPAFAAGRALVPVGCVVGIALESQGVMVAGYSEETESPAKAAGILPGDIITKIDDLDISCSEDIKDCEISSGSVTVTVNRNGTIHEFSVTPNARPDGTKELGLWLRDSLTGIGTVTYYDPETGEFGALGHPVSDPDSGAVIPIRSGQITKASLTDITQGKCGTPGQLVGVFDLSRVYGGVDANTPYGIFGNISDSSVFSSDTAVEVAEEEDIHTGEVTVISCVNGSGPKEYKAEITRIDKSGSDGRCLMIKITDDELLSLTGGIVQGMSGSPILQDGKLIGAVTHVLVNDPTKGYGISIEKMLEAAA